MFCKSYLVLLKRILQTLIEDLCFCLLPSVATCQREPCVFSVCSLLTLLYINSHLLYIYYYVSACFRFCQINNYYTIPYHSAKSYPVTSIEIIGVSLQLICSCKPSCKVILEERICILTF